MARPSQGSNDWQTVAPDSHFQPTTPATIDFDRQARNALADTMTLPAPFSQIDADSLSPQVLRIMQLAAIESQRGLNQRGDRICPEHLLVAMLQDADPGSLAYEVLFGAGWTIADVRSGKKSAAESADDGKES